MKEKKKDSKTKRIGKVLAGAALAGAVGYIGHKMYKKSKTRSNILQMEDLNNLVDRSPNIPFRRISEPKLSLRPDVLIGKEIMHVPKKLKEYPRMNHFTLREQLNNALVRKDLRTRRKNTLGGNYDW